MNAAVLQLKPGDEVGGGWGDPARRSRTAIEADIADGKVTAAAAARDYGGDE